MKFFTTIIFCCLVNLSAQNNVFRNFSIIDGLPDNHVKSIIQDSNGFIWFGTQNGLTRFDGYEFRIFKNDPAFPNSLSNNGIWVLHEGKSGCIWIGTQNGDLNKYDPKKNYFEHFKICGTKDAENYISCLYEDYGGNIWIGTYNNGLYKFNPINKSIEHWEHKDTDNNSISNDFINAIICDNDGTLWIGTYSGLNEFNYTKNKQLFKKYFYNASKPSSLTSNLIWNITKSKINPEIFYIGTYKGLTIFNSKTKLFEKILPVKNPSNQFSNSIGSVIEKKSAQGIELWLGGYGGLINYNLSTKKFHEWHHDKKISGSLIGEQINDLLLDKSGVLWVATEDGVSCLPGKSRKFNDNYLQNFSLKDREVISNLNILSIAQTKNGVIYIGAVDGLKYISTNNNNSELVSIPQFDRTNIWSIANGNSNNLWIGTYGKGLYSFNINTLKINHILFQSPTNRATPYNYVKSIYEDNLGQVWVGFWGGGLAIINLKTGQQKIFRKDINFSSGISFNDVWKIYCDSYGRTWIGTNGGGLNLAYRKAGSSTQQTSLYNDKAGYSFYKLADAKLKLNCKNVLSICEQKNNLPQKNVTILWIGTTDGLCKLEIKNIKDFKNLDDIILNSKQYSIRDGLVNNVISQIVEDDFGNLWLATNFGLSKLNVKDEKFINFTSFDGLSGNNFSTGALIKSRNDIIYAGNNGGLNIFRPEDIKLSGFRPHILFTDFFIHNKEVSIAEDSPLKTDISFTKQIILNYNQNTFTLYFSATDYNVSGLINYSYLMDGFDKDWITTDHRNYAVYTNLNSGSYVFKVKSTNSDNIWNETPAEIKIIIKPPWWRTTWAYFIYIFLIVAGLFAVGKFQVSRTELRNELKMREFEAKKLQELENLKSRFFANLSHEFRTPLMLIKGPVEQLKNEFAQSNLNGNGCEEQLNIIYRNSQKLQELIDQLLELSQLEAASIPLKARQENLIIIVKGILHSFEYMAKQKNIKLIFNCKEEIITAWIDRDKLEKIINNLLSNAFKFTKSNGTVSIFIGLNNATGNAVIKIADTGIGIPEDKIDKIFNRFFQADDSSRKAFGGSGIGLALVKELVELHKWKIYVQSIFDKGTEFTLLIPVGDYLEENEKVYEKNNISKKSEVNKEISNLLISNGHNRKTPVLPVTTNILDKKVSILIVEDSSDVRTYLSGLLKLDFTKLKNDFQHNVQLKITEAENGKEGLKIAAEQMPDLIISDIMMPFMDGIEFCQQIKTNWETSHIPVILLTAKASSESKIEGLETGADDYLTKPFDSKELLIRVKNLLEQRRQLKEKFSKEIKISTDSVTTTSLDNEFLNKALTIAEKNISNSRFDSNIFAKEMFVSRSQLHRKLLAITGQAPGEFLRLIRLKHAARLLLEKNLSVTQIAFEVGFNSPSHFAKAFHTQFNCLPSEFSEFCNKSAKV